MKQIKEDTEKNKQAELRRGREVAQLRKEQLKKEGLIRNLEKEKRQKDVVLRRKQEEVNETENYILILVTLASSGGSG